MGGHSIMFGERDDNVIVCLYYMNVFCFHKHKLMWQVNGGLEIHRLSGSCESLYSWTFYCSKFCKFQGWVLRVHWISYAGLCFVTSIQFIKKHKLEKIWVCAKITIRGQELHLNNFLINPHFLVLHAVVSYSYDCGKMLKE